MGLGFMVGVRRDIAGLILSALVLIGLEQGCAEPNSADARPQTLVAAAVAPATPPTATFFAPTSSVKPAKKVFAHYMLCCGSFGDTVDAYVRDIQLAKSIGIDGFAINAGGWDAYYRQNAASLFKAAEREGSGFQLFFSADMCCALEADDIVDMMKTYARRANYFARNGRPLLTTYAGEAGKIAYWRDKVLVPLRGSGIDAFFVPSFFPVTPTELPADEVAYWSSIVDGLFKFEPAATPFGSQSNVKTNEAFARALGAAGKLFMAGYYPFYWGSEQPTAGRRYYEYRGGLGTDAQWRSIIAVQDPEWVEIVTWNDLNESYLVPPNKDPDGFYKTHVAFLALNKYYIQWFKSGVQPSIAKDALFYFYRTHGKNLSAPGDPLGAVTRLHGDVRDDIYLTVALTAPAQLRVDTGGFRMDYRLEAGLSHLSVPFAPGRQGFELWRDGALLCSAQGEPILSAITRYNFFYTTGVAQSVP